MQISRPSSRSLYTHVLLGSLVLFQSIARADDYATTDAEWNGLGAFLTTLSEAGVTVQTPHELDVDALRPADALVIVYPQRSLPAAGLSAFMRRGGRVALADDFGTGTEVLSVYRIQRNEPSVASAPRLRGNAGLLLAEPKSRHVLTQGVGALVTNHPMAVAHHELDPLFGFGGRREALVLAGAVGEGRLVTIADPSIFINNMMEFQGNRRFTANLAHYLVPTAKGRLYVIAGEARLTGAGADQAPVEAAGALLKQLAEADVPPLALQLAAIILAAILLVVAGSSLPRRSPYHGKRMLPEEAPAGGFAGRIEMSLRRGDDLFHPLMVYKFELEGAILRGLGLTDRTLLRRVIGDLATRGAPNEDIAELRALLVDLDTLEQREHGPPGPPRVSGPRFREFVQRGDRVLATLQEYGVQA